MDFGPWISIVLALAECWLLAEAATTGRLTSVLRSLFHAATTRVIAFCAAFGLFVGYSMGIAFVVIAMMKLIFPNNVGFWMTPNGMLVSGGVNFPSVRAGLVFHTSYWIVPGALFIGFGLLLATTFSRAAGSPGSAIAGNGVPRSTLDLASFEQRGTAPHPANPANSTLPPFRTTPCG